MTTNVISQLGDKWLPMAPEKFFTMQRAADMWFGDELPPTVQDEMRSPLVTQPKMMAAFQITQQLQRAEQHRLVELEQFKQRIAAARVGKRVKTKRH